MLPFLHQVANGVVLSVKLQPRAKANEIEGPLGNELKIKITAPPVDGAANEALLRFLAKRLGRQRASIQLLQGKTSQHKKVHLSGVTLEFVATKLLRQ
jgi:uncharacterized protein